jgi:4-amino-4-deoxy-L-arabinose transferase-like glycosyltransferase
MSSDVDLALTSFNQLFWQPRLSADLRQHYRLIDAPITRYLIGAGRLLTGTQPLSTDWDWSKSWQQNESNGALPSALMLLTARFSVSWLSIVSLILVFDLVRQIARPSTALLAVILLGLNPLFLLHTRRAMAESALLFFSLLSLWSLFRLRKYPILMGAFIAFAFCAKQTGIVLLAPALFVLMVQPQKKVAKKIVSLLKLTLTFLGVVILLNPFLWAHPLDAVKEAYRQRNELTQNQQNLIFYLSPGKNINIPSQKVASLIGNLYFMPPATADVANYKSETAEAEDLYFNNPINNLGSSPFLALMAFVLTIFGFVVTYYRVVKQHDLKSNTAIFLLTGVCFGAGVLLFSPLPFQRYYLPLLPFIVICIVLVWDLL